MYVEPSFIRELCRSHPNLEEFMIAADILIRSDCYLIDSCRRVVEQPNAEVEEADFVVVGGGVAGDIFSFAQSCQYNNILSASPTRVSRSRNSWETVGKPEVDSDPFGIGSGATGGHRHTGPAELGDLDEVRLEI